MDRGEKILNKGAEAEAETEAEAEAEAETEAEAKRKPKPVGETRRFSMEDVQKYCATLEDVSVTFTFLRGTKIPRLVFAWENIGLNAQLLDALVRARYRPPSPFQIAAIPFGMQKSDILGIAKPGSGKTTAYILPMLQHVSTLPPLNPREGGSYAVVIAPSLSFVAEIEREVLKFAPCLGIKVRAFAGRDATEALGHEAMRGFEVVIGTPWCFLQCLDNGWADFKQCRYLVLDKVNWMLDEPWRLEHEVLITMNAMPSGNAADGRTTCFFGTEITYTVGRLARKYMKDVILLTAEDKTNLNVVSPAIDLQQPTMVAPMAFSGQAPAHSLPRLALGALPSRGRQPADIQTKSLQTYRCKKLRAKQFKTHVASSMSNSEMGLNPSSSDTVKNLYLYINDKNLKQLGNLISTNCIFEDSSFSKPFQGKKVLSSSLATLEKAKNHNHIALVPVRVEEETHSPHERLQLLRIVSRGTTTGYKLLHAWNADVSDLARGRVNAELPTCSRGIKQESLGHLLDKRKKITGYKFINGVCFPAPDLITGYMSPLGCGWYQSQILLQTPT
ncbi:hypothetical protein RJ640_018947 [Escallonia rubra]|uniref:Helicase ATP-binding domain-containing protein n=1 Tax=Escallonia rubra TaxID=112253 RepID=A0AA88UGZ7_9ASTE|nr:hypothetical protein RJ640_018947 [Escallonia rubra]